MGIFSIRAAWSPNVHGNLPVDVALRPLVKSAQIPFQTWLGEAMEAPTPISCAYPRGSNGICRSLSVNQGLSCFNFISLGFKKLFQ